MSTPRPPWQLATLGLLATLYFSQGLPFGFFTQALPVLMRDNGYSLGAIGLSSLLALPWALKFLWAPVVDRFWSPRLGRRRSWLIPLQIITVLVCTVLAITAEAESMNAMMAAVFVLNLLAATQDIATDGLAVDRIQPAQRGMANGIQVAGYRVGMIVGGGALLIAYEHIGGTWTFIAMAALTALASLPVLLAKPERAAPAPRPGPAETRPNVRHFIFRPDALRLIALIVAYKLGDAFGTAMLRPFLADAGLTLADIGWLLGTVGFVCGLLGALIGGILVPRLGRKTALLTFAGLQAITLGGYAFAAFSEPSYAVLATLCGAEHMAGGMATVALFTCMMDWSRPAMGATDYTVQASTMVVATGVASAIAGFSAQALGYVTHFAVSAGLALLAVAVVWALFPTPGQRYRSAGTNPK